MSRLELAGMRGWFGLLVTLVMTNSVSSAGPCADFRGTWVLDRTASDSLEPMLEAQGIPAMQRRIYAKLGVTLQVEQSADVVRIRFITALASETEELKTDGSTQNREVPYLGPIEYSSDWQDGGKVLETRTQARQGQIQGTVRRYLSDQGDIFYHDAVVITTGGKTCSARRLFRRRDKVRPQVRPLKPDLR